MLTPTPDTFKDAITWPWPGIGQIGMSSFTSHQVAHGIGMQSPQVPSGPPIGWILPYPQVSHPASLGVTPGVSVWPYPSVPDTGYNSVPLKALSFGDYSMPLGDHLTPAIKEKFGDEITVHQCF